MSYQIVIKPMFCSGSLVAGATHFYSEFDSIVEFDTFAEAEEKVSELESGDYEHSRPEYKVIEGFAYGIDCLDTKGEGFEGVINAIDPAIESKLHSMDVEYHSAYDADHAIYAADFKANGYLYTINYVVSNLALEIHVDDLGGIDWEHPVIQMQEID